MRSFTHGTLVFVAAVATILLATDGYYLKEWTPNGDWTHLEVDQNWAAYDGSHIAQNIKDDGTTVRATLALKGWHTFERDHPCGHEARLKLASLIRERKVLQLEYKMGKSDGDGREPQAVGPVLFEIAREMIAAGVAGLDENVEDEELKLLNEAMKIKGGCYWSVSDPDEWISTSEGYDSPTDDQPGDGVGLNTGARRVSLDENNLSDRGAVQMSSFPTGFTVTRVSKSYLSRPVDFLFLPNGKTLVAHNEGRVSLLDDDGKALPVPFVDVRSITNDYHDHGMMSIAIAPDYETNPYLYFFIVFDHTLDPEEYMMPRTSRVMRVKINDEGTQELPETREIVVGSEFGFGCAEAELVDANCDCLSADGKSHVGGGLAFNSDGHLFVTVGDGGIAWIVEEARRSQQMNTFSGKVLKVSVEDGKLGEGLVDNPFFTGNVNDRRSKIYALGVRNVLHIHPSPVNKDNFYIGDTMWLTKEDISVVKRGTNMGWPCYESDILITQWAKDPECLYFDDHWTHTPPIIGWAHGSSTASSMIGERIRIDGWPDRYYDVLTYGDMAGRFVGFAKLDANDDLVEDLERIFVSESPVQFRAGPGDALYYISVRGQGQLMKITYSADSTPLQVSSMQPAPGSSVAPADVTCYGAFSKSVEPDSVNENTVYLKSEEDTVVDSDLTFNYALRSFVVKPTSDLEAGKSYTLVIKGGVDGILDLDHNILASDLYYTFSTVVEGDTTAPTVVGTLPNSEGILAHRNGLVSVTFSEKMNEASISGAFKVEPAHLSGEDIVVSGAPIIVTDVSYLASASTMSFSAEMVYSQRYLVTIFGGDNNVGVTDEIGNHLAEDYVFSFLTGANPISIQAEILTPVENTEAAVGDEILFSGTATDQNGNDVPESAFIWQINVRHCTYSSPPSCHSHGAFEFEGVKSGSFEAPNHSDRFFYEVYLLIEYDGQTVEITRVVETKKVLFTLDSEPQGLKLSLSGYESTTPFSEYVALNSKVQIFAYEFAGDDDSLVFSEWLEGGQRAMALYATEDTTFTASYADASGGDDVDVTGIDRLILLDTVDKIPVSGPIDIDIEYEATVDRDIFVIIQKNGVAGAMHSKRYPVDAGAMRTTISFDPLIMLEEGVEYKIRLDLRERGGTYSSRLGTLVITATAAPNEAPSGDFEGVTFEDSVHFVQSPTTIPRDGPFSVKIEWTATEDRDIVMILRAKGLNKNVGTFTLEVGEGMGEADIGPLSYSGLTEADGPFLLKIQIRARGGQSSDIINQNGASPELEPEETASPVPEVTTSPEPEVTTSPEPEVTTSPEPEVTTSPEPEVTTSPAPEATSSPEPEVTTSPIPAIDDVEYVPSKISFIPDVGPATLNVKYSATMQRDVFVLLRTAESKEVITSKTVTVEAGVGTVGMTLDYSDLDTTLEYQLRLEVREVGANFTGRKARVDAIVAARNSDIEATESPEPIGDMIFAVTAAEPVDATSTFATTITYAALSESVIDLVFKDKATGKWVGKKSIALPASPVERDVTVNTKLTASHRITSDTVTVHAELTDATTAQSTAASSFELTVVMNNV